MIVLLLRCPSSVGVSLCPFSSLSSVIISLCPYSSLSSVIISLCPFSSPSSVILSLCPFSSPSSVIISLCLSPLTHQRFFPFALSPLRHQWLFPFAILLSVVLGIISLAHSRVRHQWSFSSPFLLSRTSYCLPDTSSALSSVTASLALCLRQSQWLFPSLFWFSVIRDHFSCCVSSSGPRPLPARPAWGRWLRPSGGRRRVGGERWAKLLCTARYTPHASLGTRCGTSLWNKATLHDVSNVAWRLWCEKTHLVSSQCRSADVTVPSVQSVSSQCLVSVVLLMWSIQHSAPRIAREIYTSRKSLCLTMM